ncbi:hypothetical protein [Neomesorhizobium albiziae]|nr:hypothetical protein [Mesorhizobium albiziae]
MAGTKIATDPAFFGEPDTDSVLWRRHERPTDRIWIPGADITFRSAITWAVLTNDNFPVITDSNTSVGMPGDVIDPDLDNAADFKRAKHDCDTAWRSKNWLAGTPVVGITGVSINRFVDNNGNPTSTGGHGRTGLYSYTSSPDPFCIAPQDLAITEAGGFLVVDPSTNHAAYMANSFEGDSRLIGHEIGHVLGLEHGDGVDSNDNNVFDGYPPSRGCDPNEPQVATSFSPSIMNNPSTNLVTRNRPGNRDQFTRARAFASKLSGGLTDPPGFLAPGPSIGDRAFDPYDDVSSRSVDVLSVGLAFSPIREAVMLSQELFGLIDGKETNQYLFFLDLDAVRIPMKPATDSDLKPAGHSDFIPAAIPI